jgi:hypothetical protein
LTVRDHHLSSARGVRPVLGCRSYFLRGFDFSPCWQNLFGRQNQPDFKTIAFDFGFDFDFLVLDFDFTLFSLARIAFALDFDLSLAFDFIAFDFELIALELAFGS